MYTMKRYTAAQARKNLAEVLDAAERGESVVIERRGVRFGVAADHSPRRPANGPPVLEILDPAVAEGQWTWELGAKGLRFRRRGKST